MPKPKAAFTDISVRNLKPKAARYEVPDPGCRGLRLVVHPSGSKAFVIRTRIGGRTAKLTLGSFPTLTLAAAREAATHELRKVKEGHDPRQARRAAKAKAKEAAADTLEAVAKDYFHRRCGGLRTVDQRYRLFNQHIFGKPIGARPIGAIKRSELVKLLKAIEDGSGARTADVVLSILRPIFNNYAIENDDFTTPFVPGMARGKRNKRERILADDEIRRVWTASAGLGTFGVLVKFLLYTGARRGEAAGITWDEIVGDVWRLPASRNKTKVALERPLSRAALAIVEGRPRIDGAPFVFGAGRRGPIRNFTKGKQRLDQVSGVTGWTIHDLRRTARSLLSRAGVCLDHSERALGHTVGGVRGIYDQHKYTAEMREAFEALAGLIGRILDPREDNVIPLRG